MIPERILRGLGVVEGVKVQIGGWDERGVPWLNKKELEHIATFVLARLDPRVLKQPGQTNVAGMLNYLRKHHDLNVKIEDLAESDGVRIIGKTVFSKNTIWIHKGLVLNDHPAYRFTVAHELGHWLLHQWRPIRLRKPKEYLTEIVDTETELYRRIEARLPESPVSLIEAQASIFASCLIIPRTTLTVALMTQQLELGIGRNFGVVFLNRDDHSWSDFNKTVAYLQSTFGVSRQSVLIKLKTLGILKAKPECEAKLFPPR